jgi:hypothetical protein
MWEVQQLSGELKSVSLKRLGQVMQGQEVESQLGSLL